MPEPASAAFVSYSREDSEFALRLAQDLRAAGASVWLDQMDIKPGHAWDNSIEEALDVAPVMLLVLSPSSARSENVRNEISYALEAGKIVIPVLYRDCVVPLRLQRAQRIDFRADYASALKALLGHLNVTHAEIAIFDKKAEEEARRQAALQASEAEAQRLREIQERPAEPAVPAEIQPELAPPVVARQDVRTRVQEQQELLRQQAQQREQQLRQRAREIEERLREEAPYASSAPSVAAYSQAAPPPPQARRSDARSGAFPRWLTFGLGGAGVFAAILAVTFIGNRNTTTTAAPIVNSTTAPAPIAPAPDVAIPISPVPTENPRSAPKSPAPRPSEAVSIYQEAVSTKDWEAAMPLLEKSCSLGYAEGCMTLGYRYDEAIGTKPDVPRALALYREACTAGNFAGCNHLADHYTRGVGVKQDLSLAKQFYEKACTLGDHSACEDLKDDKFSGISAKQD